MKVVWGCDMGPQLGREGEESPCTAGVAWDEKVASADPLVESGIDVSCGAVQSSVTSRDDLDRSVLHLAVGL